VYAFVDRPVTSLDRGCRFLVWSMRSWVMAVHGRTCPGPALAPAFAKWRMVSGLQPFLRLMLVLNRDALNELHFCSLKCNRIGEDEAVVLSLFVAVGTGERIAARDTLALMLGEDSLGDALAAIGQVSGALCTADMAPAAPQSLGPV
jgi:hypothetical protein